MTHTIARPLRSRPALDPGRIAAEAGTIAVNVVLLMALMAPLSPPPPSADRPKPFDVILVPRQIPRPVDPPVRAKVVPRPAAAPRPEIARPPLPRPVVQDSPPVLVEHGEPPIADIVSPPHTDTPLREAGGTGDASPLAGAQLQYEAAPPPPYPREAIREGLAGTVLLEVLVDVDGRPLRVDIVRSSGQRVLDMAAKRQVLSRWRFVPATRDGRPVQAIGRVPVEFTLDR